jgi:hypothetical protein
MSEHDHDTVPLRIRSVGDLFLEDQDITVSVDHVYLAEGSAGACDNCGGPCRDPGFVGLGICDVEEGGEHMHAQLTPSEALLLANRLERAANLVLESEEDVPDIEREAARLGGPKAGAA